MSKSAGGTFNREDALRNGLVHDVSVWAMRAGIPWKTAISKTAFNKIKPTKFEEKKQMDMISKRIRDMMTLYGKYWKMENKPAVLEFYVPLFRWSDDLLVEKFIGILTREKEQVLLTICDPSEVHYNYEPHIEHPDGSKSPLFQKPDHK